MDIVFFDQRCEANPLGQLFQVEQAISQIKDDKRGIATSKPFLVRLNAI